MQVSRRRLILMLAGAVTLTGLVTAHFTKPKEYRNDVTAVEPGRLYRSGQLEPDRLAEAIRERGIRTVVNLGTEQNWDPEVCQRLGVNYIEMLVGDVHQLCGVKNPKTDLPATPAFNLDPLWALIESPESSPVLIHCWGGTHRTGVVTALYRIHKQHWPVEDAIAELEPYGFNLDSAKFAPVLEYLRTLDDAAAAEMVQRPADAAAH